MGSWWERSDGFRVILRSGWDFFFERIFSDFRLLRTVVWCIIFTDIKKSDIYVINGYID